MNELELNHQLFEAITNSNFTQLQELISQGVDLNWLKCPEKVTPLSQAVYCENLEIIRILIQAGAKAKSLPNILEIAAELGNTKIVRFLLKSELTFTPNKLRDALCTAVCYGHIETISVLLNGGADVNRADESGITPLMNAALSEQVESAKFLVEAGANIETVDLDGKTALFFAAQSGHQKVFEYLYSFTSNRDLREDAQKLLSSALLYNKRK